MDWKAFMLRFYVRLSFVLLPIFMLLVITMSVLPSLQPTHPALRGFAEGCKGQILPCWYGIVTPLTTVEEANLRLEVLGFRMLSYSPPIPSTLLSSYSFEVIGTSECDQLTVYVLDESQLVYSFAFEKCDDLLLGDIIDYFGNPDEVFYCLQLPYPLLFYRQWGINIEPHTIDFNMQPNSPVESITTQIGPIPGEYGRWQGFVPFESYRNLEPASIVNSCLG
jgi:hypothetical protein